MSVFMKCVEWIVSQHIKNSLLPSLNPQQFAYRANQSTEDAITLYRALSHLENMKNYVCMLFMGYSSAFNTIILDILTTKLNHLQIPPCHLLLDQRLPHQPASITPFLGTHISADLTWTHNTNTP